MRSRRRRLSSARRRKKYLRRWPWIISTSLVSSRRGRSNCRRISSIMLSRWSNGFTRAPIYRNFQMRFGVPRCSRNLKSCITRIVRGWWKHSQLIRVIWRPSTLKKCPWLMSSWDMEGSKKRYFWWWQQNKLKKTKSWKAKKSKNAKSELNGFPRNLRNNR